MPWFGPPMSAASMATARFMETWAHAHDVYDAAGERYEPTDRIRPVAHLGVRTRNYAYSVHQEEPPAEEFRVELTAPSGELWTWGPEDAAQRVTRSGVRLLPAGHPAGQPRRHRPGRGRRRRRALAGHRAGVRRPARPRSRGDVMTEPLVVGNCSGFYGDRLSAMREQLEGGRLDVLTGDYLAELTMLILGKDTMKDPSLGYARTFVRQLEDCLGLALERGVKIVSNAGGLNPAGLADRIREVAKGLGLDPAVAHVEGDDLRPLGLETRRRADRQRLPRRLRHRRRPHRRRRRRGHRPGHRRERRGRAGRRAPRLDADVVRRARRCRGRGARHRVRRPGDRRQLLRLPPAGRRTAWTRRSPWASRSPRSPPTAPA